MNISSTSSRFINIYVNVLACALYSAQASNIWPALSLVEKIYEMLLFFYTVSEHACVIGVSDIVQLETE